MIYFSEDFLEFMRELPANNNREWFNSQKERYVKKVRLPFEKFIGDLISELRKLQKDSPSPLPPGLESKDCIFRIYRDMRFSKDKTPYKIQISAFISANGRKDMRQSGTYIELSGEHVQLYGGVYMPTREFLTQIRKKIYTDPVRLEKLAEEKSFKKEFGEIRGEKNIRIPRPFSLIAAKHPLILNKSFYYFKTYQPEIVLENDFMKQIIADSKIMWPLNRYFEDISE